MASLPHVFDASQVPEDERNFDPLPAGEYHVQVIDSGVTDTKNGQGVMVKLTMEVISGEFANRKLFDNIMYQHSNAQAQSIGQRRLADLIGSIGENPHMQNTEDLHFKPCIAVVKVKPASGDYGPGNEVRTYKPAGAAPAAVQRAAPVQHVAAQAPAASAGNRPWARKTA